MLCERPAATTSYPSEPPAFRPSSVTDSLRDWGLPPLKKVNSEQNCTTYLPARYWNEIDVSSLMQDSQYVYYKPLGAVDRNKIWVKELDQQMKEAREAAEKAAAEEKAKQQALADFSKNLRTAILNNEDVGPFWKQASGRMNSTGALSPSATTARDASPAHAVHADSSHGAAATSQQPSSSPAAAPAPAPKTVRMAEPEKASSGASTQEQASSLSAPKEASPAIKAAPSAEPTTSATPAPAPAEATPSTSQNDNKEVRPSSSKPPTPAKVGLGS